MHVVSTSEGWRVIRYIRNREEERYDLPHTSMLLRVELEHLCCSAVQTGDCKLSAQHCDARLSAVHRVLLEGTRLIWVLSWYRAR